MRKKEEILEHLNYTGYDDKSIQKIMGYLIGKGLKDVKETIKVKRGNNTFDTFIDWMDGKESSSEINKAKCIKEIEVSLNRIYSAFSRYASENGVDLDIRTFREVFLDPNKDAACSIFNDFMKFSKGAKKTKSAKESDREKKILELCDILDKISKLC